MRKAAVKIAKINSFINETVKTKEANNPKIVMKN